MTEDRDKWRKYVHGVATLGSRTAKEQNRTPLEWRRVPTLVQRFPSKAYRLRKGLKSPPD